MTESSDRKEVVFEILGQLPSLKNSRDHTVINGRARIYLSSKAKRYRKDFLKQIPGGMKRGWKEPVAMKVTIYYSSKLPDLCTAFLQDLVQDAGIIGNDRLVWKWEGADKRFDKNNPRVVLGVRLMTAEEVYESEGFYLRQLESEKRLRQAERKKLKMKARA